MENVAEIVALLRRQAQLESQILPWHWHRHRLGAGTRSHPEAPRLPPKRSTQCFRLYGRSVARRTRSLRKRSPSLAGQADCAPPAFGGLALRVWPHAQLVARMNWPPYSERRTTVRGGRRCILVPHLRPYQRARG